MPLTDAEQKELDLILSDAAKARALAEDPKTPTPLTMSISQENPTVAPTPTGAPVKEAPGMMDHIREIMGGNVAPLNPEQEEAKSGLPEVPVGAQDRVFVDALTRGWSDKAIALARGTTKEQERANTAMARMEAGDSAKGFELAGEIAPYFILGGGAGGIIKTALTGGAMMTADKALEVGGKEDRLPDADEAAVAAMYGAAGGAASGILGNFIGRGMSGLYNKFTGGKEIIPEYIQKVVTTAARETDEAGKLMDASGVVVKGSYLNKLLKSVETKVKGIQPEGTPKAWAAFQRFKAGVARNGDLTLRQLNELRRGISEIKGKKYEQKYIDDIGGEVNRFMSNLPGNPGAVASGDAMKGVDAWKKMNAEFQKKLKLDAIAEKIAIAESRAGTSKMPIDKALQEQFAQWTGSKAGRKEFKNLFSKEERDALMPLTKGTWTIKRINASDRVLKGLIGGIPAFLIRAALRAASYPAGQHAMQQVGQGVGKVLGEVAPSATPAMSNVVSRIARPIGLEATKPEDSQPY